MAINIRPMQSDGDTLEGQYEVSEWIDEDELPGVRNQVEEWCLEHPEVKSVLVHTEGGYIIYRNDRTTEVRASKCLDGEFDGYELHIGTLTIRATKEELLQFREVIDNVVRD